MIAGPLGDFFKINRLLFTTVHIDLNRDKQNNFSKTFQEDRTGNSRVSRYFLSRAKSRETQRRTFPVTLVFLADWESFW